MTSEETVKFRAQRDAAKAKWDSMTPEEKAAHAVIRVSVSRRPEGWTDLGRRGDRTDSDHIGFGARSYRWGLGPTFVILHLDKGDPWVYGFLVNNVWSVGNGAGGSLQQFSAAALHQL